MLQAEGGSLVPLINVGLPTVWERGQVWRWTKLFIYFLIVKQAGYHPQCFLYLCVCSKWKAVRSEVMPSFIRKSASAGRHWALSGPEQRYNFLQKGAHLPVLILHAHGEGDLKANYKNGFEHFSVLYQEKSRKSPKDILKKRSFKHSVSARLPCTGRPRQQTAHAFPFSSKCKYFGLRAEILNCCYLNHKAWLFLRVIIVWGLCFAALLVLQPRFQHRHQQLCCWSPQGGARARPPLLSPKIEDLDTLNICPCEVS